MNYVIVGEWVIREAKDGKLVISHVSGESGEFDAAKFAEVIAEFFNREF